MTEEDTKYSRAVQKIKEVLNLTEKNQSQSTLYWIKGFLEGILEEPHNWNA